MYFKEWVIKLDETIDHCKETNASLWRFRHRHAIRNTIRFNISTIRFCQSMKSKITPKKH